MVFAEPCPHARQRSGPRAWLSSRIREIGSRLSPERGKGRARDRVRDDWKERSRRVGHRKRRVSSYRHQGSDALSLFGRSGSLRGLGLHPAERRTRTRADVYWTSGGLEVRIIRPISLSGTDRRRPRARVSGGVPVDRRHRASVIMATMTALLPSRAWTNGTRRPCRPRRATGRLIRLHALT